MTDPDNDGALIIVAMPISPLDPRPPVSGAKRLECVECRRPVWVCPTIQAKIDAAEEACVCCGPCLYEKVGSQKFFSELEKSLTREFLEDDLAEIREALAERARRIKEAEGN